MAKPGVSVNKKQGSLGGSPKTLDGVSLLIVTAPSEYTISVNKVLQLKDAEDAGITEANDLANNSLVWEHIKDFYAIAPEGTELHILALDEAVTISNIFTDANAANNSLLGYLSQQNGRIRLIGVALNPSFAENHTTSISSDLDAAIALAHNFADDEFGRQRPVEIFIEGRKLAGTATNATDLTAKNAGNVSVIVGRDGARKDVLTTAGNTGAANYAAIGLWLGSVAASHVGRNAGRNRNGKLPIISPQFSGGQIPYDDFTETDLNTLYGKSYIFMDRYLGLDGWYWVDDMTCEDADATNAKVSLNRVINKVARLVVSTYNIELKNEFPVDTSTGYLEQYVVSSLEAALEGAVRNEMIENPDSSRERELSGITVSIPRAQNVLASGNKLTVKVKAVPLFVARTLEVDVQLENPANTL